MNGEKPEEFYIKHEIKQGDNLSSLLFNEQDKKRGRKKRYYSKTVCLNKCATH